MKIDKEIVENMLKVADKMIANRKKEQSYIKPAGEKNLFKVDIEKKERKK